ncbi:MAG: hypothetical protein U0354_15830 [Candidatus Sericytochromatia bacterium]
MIDTEYNTAYPISALQTDSNCENRMDFYLKHIENNKEYFKEIKHIAFDGFHSKKSL